MLINSITLENFKQYKGKNQIDFSTSPEKNVTIIIGDNTCGKTTLVQSFIWCLYGKADFKDKIVLNAEEYAELSKKIEGTTKECCVSVKLFHNNTNYLITRSQKFRVNKSGKIEVDNSVLNVYDDSKVKGSYTVVDLDNSNTDVIATILPENLADYFFFWGERIEKISDRKELTGAVKQFLGLDTIELAEKHLKRVISSMNSASIPNSDNMIEGYTQKIIKYQNKNREISNEIQSIKNNIEYYEKSKDEAFSKLTSSENKELAEKQKRYNNNSKLLADKTNLLAKYQKQYSDKFNDSKNYVYALGNAIQKKAIKLLKDNPEPIVGWHYIDINAINEIIKRGKCICGNEICEHNDAYNYLIGQKNIVAPNEVGGAINSFIEECERKEEMNEEYISSINDKLKEIRELTVEIDDIKNEIKQLEKEIVNVGKLEDVKNKYDYAEEKLLEYQKKLGQQDAEYKRNENQISICERNKMKLMNQNKKYEKQVKEISLARSVLESFIKDDEEDKIKLKNSLEKHVNDNFNEIYNGNRIIRIDESYHAIPYNMVDNKWIASETSPGLETVKNFAFICGLVQCAKDKIIESEDYHDQYKNDYPLVLDAPFSQADEKHIPAISQLISKNAEQIILVVMKKDWNYAQNILSDKVGKQYKLIKETETKTVVEEAQYD